MINLFEYFEKNLENHPDQIAFLPSRLTFRDVQDRIQIKMVEFQKWGIVSGSHCLIATPVGDAFFINIMALLQIGAIPVLIDISLGFRTVFRALRPITIHAIIFERGLIHINNKDRISNFESKSKSKSRDTSARSSFLSLSPPLLFVPEGSSTLATIYFTSGSTGLPKPVYYMEKELRTQIEMLRKRRFAVGEEIKEAAITEPRRPEGRILYGYSSLPVFGLYQFLMGMGIWTESLKTGEALQEAMTGPHRGFLNDLCLNPKITESWICYLDKNYLPISDFLERLTVVSNILPHWLQRRIHLRLPVHAVLEQSYGCTEVFPVTISTVPRRFQYFRFSVPEPLVGRSTSPIELDLRDWLSAPPKVLSSKTPRVSQIWVRDFSGRWIYTGDLGYLKSLDSSQGDSSVEIDFPLVVLGREKFTFRYRTSNGNSSSEEFLYFSLLWELKAREIPQIKDVVLIHNQKHQPPVLMVCLKPEFKFLSSLWTLLRLQVMLTKTFEAPFDLRVVQKLPLDPRHQSKVLRQRLHPELARWTPANLLLRFFSYRRAVLRKGFNIPFVRTEPLGGEK